MDTYKFAGAMLLILLGLLLISLAFCWSAHMRYRLARELLIEATYAEKQAREIFKEIATGEIEQSQAVAYFYSQSILDKRAAVQTAARDRKLTVEQEKAAHQKRIAADRHA